QPGVQEAPVAGADQEGDRTVTVLIRRFVGAAAAGLLAAACSPPFGIGLPSTADLVNGSADGLARASGFEVAGRFTTGGDTYTVDIKYQSSGAAHVDLTVAGAHIE